MFHFRHLQFPDLLGFLCQVQNFDNFVVELPPASLARDFFLTAFGNVGFISPSSVKSAVLRPLRPITTSFPFMELFPLLKCQG